MGFFSRLRDLFVEADLTDDFYDELEETLVLSDVGITATESIIEELKAFVAAKHVKTIAGCKECLKELLSEQLKAIPATYDWDSRPSLLMVVGVNGVGKTTSIGKLAMQFKEGGKRVVLVAGDTFRAGAAEQLKVWAERADVHIVSQHEGADPSSVLFDGIQAAKSRKADIIICDTAGRLHNKKNLMEEISKMNRVIERESAGYHKETLMVLDATTGQNALNQARIFLEATDVNGIILTKMDGTAKGGVVLAIQKELGLPIAYIGCGEGIYDLKRFDADEFVDDIFAGI